MDFNQLISIVYVVVGFVLVWLIIELALVARRTRKTVEEIKQQVEPTLEHVQSIAASLEPATKKIDPLVDRVSLTVDAANLEIMRLDQILEDVSEVTDTVSSTVSTVDAITSAPMDLVNNVTTKVRGAFRSRGASEESIALGDQKAEAARLEKESQDQLDVEGKRSRAAARIEQARKEKETADEAAAQTVPSDPASTQPAKAQEGYFTYGSSDAASGEAAAPTDPAEDAGEKPQA